MISNFLTNYWPVILVAAFIGWRLFRFRKVRMQIPQLLEKGALIIDVRNPDEFLAGANPISMNVPLGQIDSRTKNLDRNKTLILCCASGTRSAMAVAAFKALGFKNVINAGPWTNTLVKG